MSILPKRESTASAIAVTCAFEVMSACTAMDSTPQAAVTSRAVRSAASADTSAITGRPPASAITVACCTPRSPAPPVIIATWPVRSKRSLIGQLDRVPPDCGSRDGCGAFVETCERRFDCRNVLHVVDLENRLVDHKWQDLPPAHQFFVKNDLGPDDVDVPVLPEDLGQALARLAVRLDDVRQRQDGLEEAV